MGARASAQTDVAASSRILALITAKQRGNRESDTQRERARREAGCKGPEEIARDRQDPRGLGLSHSAAPRAGRGDRFEVCTCAGPERSRRQGESSPRRWRRQSRGCSSDSQPAGWPRSSACSPPPPKPLQTLVPRCPDSLLLLPARGRPGCQNGVWGRGGPGALPRKEETDKGVGGRD